MNENETVNGIEEQVVGRRKEIRLILAAVKTSIPVLIEGGVGRGKTKVSLEVAKALKRPFFRVDGAPDVTVQKIVGWFDPSLVLLESDEAQKRGIKAGFTWDTFILGPLTEAMIKGGILFINEGTRLPSDTWNALLTAMDERIVVIPKLGIVEAKPGFAIIVTANPMEHAGAYPLPEAAADRFVWIPMERQYPDEEREIIRRELQAKGYKEASMNEEALYIAEACVDQTYHHPALVTGVSVRAGIQMSCMLAELGGDFRDKNMVLQAALMAFPKKLKLRDNVTKSREEIVAEVVDAVFQGSPQKIDSEPPDGTDLFPEQKDKPNSTEEMVRGVRNKTEEDIERETEDERHLKDSRISRSKVKKSGKEVNALKFLSKDNPEKVAGQLNSDPEYVKDLLEADSEAFLEIFHRVRPWLHEKVYDLVIHTYIDTVLRRSEEIYLTGMKSPVMLKTNYESGRGEVDWEETIDRYTETVTMDVDTIVLKEPLRVKRSLVLLMDHSGSMAGRKILSAALCTGVLSYVLKSEEFAVLLFGSDVCTLKAINREKDLDRLIVEILEQQAKGFTDIKGALEAGLKQLEKASNKVRIGVLITDGIYTTGDPTPVAERYPTLHVLGVPSARGKVIKVECCKRLAEAGKGKFLMLKDYADVPLTVLKLLT
ncbi:MAG: AAA family ATPase [Candidatus Bathyarchaeota archaeon]